jgi:hypothetical protein
MTAEEPFQFLSMSPKRDVEMFQQLSTSTVHILVINMQFLMVIEEKNIAIQSKISLKQAC